MKALDHETFHAMEIDALYEELDGPSAAALRGHAASCESCSARFERLRRARQRGLAALAEAVPENFESRIMAAVDAALAKRSPRQAPPGVTAKVIPLFARPSFAVAATLILVLGAAAILSQTSMSRKASPMATSMDESASAPAASGFTPVPVPAEPVAAATATAEGAIALGEEQAGKAAQAPGAPPAARPMARVAAAPAADPAPPPAAMLAAASTPAAPPRKSAGPSAGGGAQDPAFAAAQALYNAGRYAEALPRFEALKASNPEAALYAARCIQRTRGCAAATPRFDAVAKGNSGTEVGSRARLEADSCEAKAAAGPAPAATTGPGTPGAGKPASPKTTIEPLKDDAFR